VYLSGGSAAQSSLIQYVDAAIGIKNEEPRFANFLLEMRRFMPVKHRAFLAYIENSALPNVLVNNEYLEYIDIIKNKLRAFRTEHLKVYHRYVASQQKKTTLGDMGTGGTDAVQFLNQTKNDT
jgi:indoleamine 2,3-dioxygenase